MSEVAKSWRRCAALAVLLLSGCASSGGGSADKGDNPGAWAPGGTVTDAASATRLQGGTNADWSTVRVTSSNAATSVDFLPNGLRQGGLQIEQLTIASADASERTQRRINVFGGGLIRLCDPLVAAANDPRAC